MESTSTASTALITTVDRSVKTLNTTLAALVKTAGELGSMGTVFEQLSADIQQKESEMAQLNVDFDRQQRGKAADLALAVQENEKAVLLGLLAKFELANIPVLHLEALKTDLAAAKADNKADIDFAVSAAERLANASAAIKYNDLVNKQAVETATLKAEADSRDERIAFLQNELAQTREQIGEERRARIAVAEADARRQGVVVNAGKS